MVMSPAFPYLCALRCAMGTLVDNGGCYFNGEIILPVPEVMAMKDELAELRAFKATTTPAATTGAAHPGKRARVQQDRLPEIARFRGAARCFYDFQFRGEGERCGAGIVSIKSSWTGDLHKHHECCEIPSKRQARAKQVQVQEQRAKQSN